MSVPNIAGTLRASALLRGRRTVPTLSELEAVLPAGGLLAGSLVDLHGEEGAGAFALALRIAAEQQRASGKTVVVVDATGDFHPPAAAQLGVALERLLVLRGTGANGHLGCLDEALRSRAVCAVVARVRKLDGPASHRLRVAAEQGGGLGLLVRPPSERVAISGAAVRLLVHGGERGPQVEPLRVRGGIRATGGSAAAP